MHNPTPSRGGLKNIIRVCPSKLEGWIIQAESDPLLSLIQITNLRHYLYFWDSLGFTLHLHSKAQREGTKKGQSALVYFQSPILPRTFARFFKLRFSSTLLDDS